MSKQEAGPDVERQLISQIESLWNGCANSGVVLAGGDDCAIVRAPSGDDELLLTSDQVIEHQHFLPGKHLPQALGHKALVRSLSDIAAMGGRPLYFLQTLSLPRWALGEWHDQFQQGMRQAAESLQVPQLMLVGGDVARGDRFVVSVTAVGGIERSSALLRSGARPGDRVYVSGTLGGSALGLRILLSGEDPDGGHPAVQKHCWPQPRLALGRALRKIPASAAIDVSDGLAMDANRLAAASRVAIIIDPGSVPVFPGACLEDALRSGEEYELLFTLAPGSEPPSGDRLTPIGRIECGSGVWLDSARGRKRLSSEGFSHF